MGEGPELIEADLSFDGGGLIKANILEYLPSSLADLDRRLGFSWETKNLPSEVTAIEAAEAFVWVESSTSGLPANEKVALMTDRRDLRPVKNRCYLWDFKKDSPMFLMVLPVGIPLEDAEPRPSGVWRINDRICAFWRKPGGDNKITFCLGRGNRSLAKCVRRWNRQIAGLRRAFLTDVRIFIIAALIVIGASVAAIKFYGRNDFPMIAATAASLVAILAALYTFLSRLLRMPRRFVR